jgi:hypothetical protein
MSRVGTRVEDCVESRATCVSDWMLVPRRVVNAVPWAPWMATPRDADTINRNNAELNER